MREDVFAKSAAVQSPASEAIVITRREEEALPVTEQHFVSDLVRDFYHAAAQYASLVHIPFPELFDHYVLAD